MSNFFDRRRKYEINAETDSLKKKKLIQAEKTRQGFKRIFEKEEKSTADKGIGLLFPIWIIAIIVLKINGSELGNVLLYVLLALMALGLVIELVKKGLSAIPYLIGLLFWLIISAFIGIGKFIIGLFKKKKPVNDTQNIGDE